MVRKWVGGLKTKVSSWLTKPSEEPENILSREQREPRKSFQLLDFLRAGAASVPGAGIPEKVDRRIDEFYPRGSAGRKESRGPRGAHKAVLPHRGNRPKYPSR